MSKEQSGGIKLSEDEVMYYLEMMGLADEAETEIEVNGEPYLVKQFAEICGQAALFHLKKVEQQPEPMRSQMAQALGESVRKRYIESYKQD